MRTLSRDPVLRKMNVCAHFNGIQHDACDAGVSYSAVREAGTESTPFRFACFRDESNGLTCEKAHFPMREEAEAEKRADDAAFARHAQAHRAAHDDAKAKGYGRGHGGNSSLICPLCQGTLRYSVAAYNGHMHARCETTGCVSWME
jgi:hypothetical protein